METVGGGEELVGTLGPTQVHTVYCSYFIHL